EFVFAWEKLLDKPGAVIGAVPENLGGQPLLLAAGLWIFQEAFVRVLAVRRHGIIEGRARRGREQTDDEQRREDPRQAHAGVEHGDYLVRARPPAEAEEQQH